jgi:hypothetical protein
VPEERVVQREAGDLVAEHQPGVVVEAKVLRAPSAAVPPGDELAQVPASTAIEDGAEARPTKANPVETAPIGAPAAIAPVAASADSATAAATIAVDLLLLMALPVRSGLMTGGDGAVGGRPFAPWRPPCSSTGWRQAFSSRYEGTRGGRATLVSHWRPVAFRAGLVGVGSTV